MYMLYLLFVGTKKKKKLLYWERNKTRSYCHDTQFYVCLILRQTVDQVESIDNYLDNWLVDNYADPKRRKDLGIFEQLRILLFRN